MDIQSVKQTLEDQKSTIQQFGIKNIGVYGSIARNEQTELSDIDLLLDFIPGKKTYKNYSSSIDFLRSLFSRPVDATTPQAIPQRLMPYIQKDITYVKISD